MTRLRPLGAAFIAVGLIGSASVSAKPLNKVLGTWRMISAQLDPTGKNLPAYGPAPSSLLVSTPDMHVIEVMTDSTVPKFANGAFDAT